MKKRHLAILCFGLLCCLLLLAAGALVRAVRAQGTTTVDWWVLGSSGGPVSGNGVVVMDGTLGEPAIGPASSDPVSQDAGYWYGVAREAYAIYLPLVLKEWSFCFPGPEEIEDNGSFDLANGPLCPAQEYLARPNDAEDFFYFYSGAGQVTVEMWDYTGQGGQLILYDAQEQIVVRDHDPSDGWQVAATVWAGKYYVRVFTESGHNLDVYTLRVTFP